MYLNDNDGLDGIGRSLKRTVKRVGKVARKTVKRAAVFSPGIALNRKLVKRSKVLAIPLTAPIVSTALAFRPRKPRRAAAPAASIPEDDYGEDTELTTEERNALIQDAEPMQEPMASGYSTDEETFEPDVPSLVNPGDAPQPPKKKSALPWIGGALLLLNFLL